MPLSNKGFREKKIIRDSLYVRDNSRRRYSNSKCVCSTQQSCKILETKTDGT